MTSARPVPYVRRFQLNFVPMSEQLTILFADVSGSTRLFETRGNIEARRLVASMLGALAELPRPRTRKGLRAEEVGLAMFLDKMIAATEPTN